MDYLCLSGTVDGIELAVCGYGYLAEIPADWFDDDGEPLPGHRDADGCLELPEEWDGKTVTGHEDGTFLGGLAADDEFRTEVTDFSTDSLTRALNELSWDTDDFEGLRSTILRLAYTRPA